MICNLIGDSGSGKSTLIKCIINDYYNSNNEKKISLKEIENNILIINSLKEQGISFYRNEVKTFCQTTSSILNKKKFIIMDDIDLINDQSQQVFRNCIDKYSNNINFLITCTNSQKVIDSLQSRIMCLQLKKLNKTDLLKIINFIIDKEELLIDDEDKELLIEISDYSIKNIINYLNKFYLIDEKITKELIITNCTDISFKKLEEYTHFCLEKNIVEASNYIINIYDLGYSVIDILDSFYLFIKITNLIDINIKYKIIKLICKYITIFHNIHEDKIELILFTNNLISIF